MPANVLITGDTANWMRVGIPIALQYDLSTSPHTLAGFVNDDSGVYQIGATEALRTTIDGRAHRRLHFEAVITDTSTQRNRQVITADAASQNELITVLNSIAKQVSPDATSFSTNSTNALESFTAAAQTSDRKARIQKLRDSISADPRFGLAYVLLLNTAAAGGEQDLAAALSQIADRRNSFSALDSARLNELQARLKHAAFGQRESAAAALLKLAPNDIDTLAALGSDRFLQGDANGGKRYLERAMQLNPNNERIRQQLATGLIETKQYAAAEKLLTNPTDIAVCLLLQGDVARANATMDKVIASVGNAELKTLFRANWLAISGQMNQAIQTVDAGTFSNPVVKSAALVQKSVWEAMMRDFPQARKSAAEAQRLAGTSELPKIGALLAKAEEPLPEWRRDVASSGLNAGTTEALLGYGFFLYGHYSEAAAVWQQAVTQSGDTNLRARAMLASSLDRAGRADEAHKVLVQPFVPEFGDIYAAVSFNEMRRLLK